MGILRLLYAISVFFIHTGWIKGFVLFPDILKPVYAFFIISGFYMSFILNKKYIGKKGSYMLFITNRFLRIYPIYWTVFGLSILFYFVIILGKIQPIGVYINDTIFTTYLPRYDFFFHTNMFFFAITLLSDFIRNFSIIFHCGYFVRCSDVTNYLYTTNQAWSLNPELLFYLIAPFLLTRKGLTKLFIVLGLPFLWFLFFHFQWLNFNTMGYIFVTSLIFFALGYLSFLIYEKVSIKKFSPYLIILVSILSFFFALFYFHLPLPHLQYKWMNLNDYVYFFTITLALPFLFEFSNMFRLDRAIGLLSYPLYISHNFTNEILTFTHFIKPNTQLFIYTGLVVAIAFSFGVVYLLEKPIDIYRQRRVLQKSKTLKKSNQYPHPHHNARIEKCVLKKTTHK